MKRSVNQLETALEAVEFAKNRLNVSTEYNLDTYKLNKVIRLLQEQIAETIIFIEEMEREEKES